MLIIGMILFGMLVGAAAQHDAADLAPAATARSGDQSLAIFPAGLVGSFVGGLLSSLIAGDGIALRPSGIIGSIVGAVIVTGVWRWSRTRSVTR